MNKWALMNLILTLVLKLLKFTILQPKELKFQYLLIMCKLYQTYKTYSFIIKHTKNK